MRPDPRWNDTGRPYPAGQSVHGIVRDLARARPGALALVHGDTEVTYGELDRAADTLAALLAAAGVRRGDRVPVLLPRGTTLVTVVLAVLKLGAAYGLLDPAWPDRRIAEVVGDLGGPLLVGPPEAAGRSPLPVWTPPEAPEPADFEPVGFEPVAVGGTDPCCAFFTSGTTGRPKGVLVPHRAVVRLFRPGGFADFSARTVVPQAAPLPWDGFALELWAALLSGGTSLLVDEPYLSAGGLREAVATRGMDTAWVTSSLFTMIVDEDPGAFAGLRVLMIGGERLSVPHVRAFLHRHPGIALLNGYGPVESTVFTSTHRIVPADCDRPGGIPVGRPVPDTQVYVLAGTRQCAVGEVGELCVGGHGLALGYLADPALTAAKFPELVLDGMPTRVYRTGDLGCWDADGLLHYRGRTDRQVKIRGHRVEPAEVERQVEALLDVRRCVVVVRRDDAGVSQALVACCVPREPGDPLPGALEVLAAGLAAHHRPEAVVSVDELPLTSTGKLDERALLALVPGPDPAGVDVEEDLDPLVARVAGVFAAVLGRPAVPADAPLAALGGSSLDAGRISVRLAAELGRPVPLSRLVRQPTARAVAGWLRDAPPAAALPTPARDVPLRPMQVGFLTRHLLDPDDRSAHCLGTWVLDGPLERDALTAAIGAVHARHEALRAAYVPGRAAVARLVDVPAPDVLARPAAGSVDGAVAALRAELGTGLDLAAGQVWRVTLVPVGTGAVLGYVVHHIAFDGWSEAVLAADLAAAYAGRDLALAPGLAEAWALVERHRRQADLDDQRAFLRAELAGVPPLAYPAARPGSERVTTAIGPQEVAALDAAARAAGVTRFVILLAAYGQALAGLTGQDDFGVGVPVVQRPDHRLDRSVGCHVDTVCVRLRGAAVTGSVTATGAVVARALAAQDVGFGEVVRLVNPPRSRRTPLFQNLFAYQDNAPPRLELAGVAARFVRQPYLGIPAEVQTDVWPDTAGGLRVVVDAQLTGVAGELADRFAARLRAVPAPDETPEDGR